MEGRMEQQIRIPVSMCDNTGKLGIPHIFSLFMNLASEHGEEIGVGTDVMEKKGLFWLTVKTKVRIYDRPKLLEYVTAATWPERPGKIRCNRFYTLRDGDKLLVEGKTEWATMELATGKLARVSNVYPPEMEHWEEVVCEGAYSRISEDFSDCEEISVYRVRSTDIDIGQHMNNAAYVHAMFGALSNQELSEHTVTEVDVMFRIPCYEGDRLSIRRRDIEGGVEMGIVREDGKTAVTAKIRCS